MADGPGISRSARSGSDLFASAVDLVNSGGAGVAGLRQGWERGKGLLLSLFGNGDGAPSNAAIRHCEAEVSKLQAEVAILQNVQQEMTATLDEMVASREAVLRSRTLRGRVFNILGYVLSVYGLYRVVSAMISIVLRLDPTRGKDPVTRGMEVLLIFLKVPNPHMWIQPASFVLIGVLVFTNVRGFLINLNTVFSVVGSDRGVTGNSIVLLLAQVMGTYFVATVLMMRLSMPEPYRRNVTQSFGEIEFPFFHRWFDVIFVLSACASIVGHMVVYALRQARNSGFSREEKDAFRSGRMDVRFDDDPDDEYEDEEEEEEDDHDDVAAALIGGPSGAGAAAGTSSSGRASPAPSPRTGSGGSTSSGFGSGLAQGHSSGLFSGAGDLARRRGTANWTLPRDADEDADAAARIVSSGGAAAAHLLDTPHGERHHDGSSGGGMPQRSPRRQRSKLLLKTPSHRDAAAAASAGGAGAGFGGVSMGGGGDGSASGDSSSGGSAVGSLMARLLHQPLSPRNITRTLSTSLSTGSDGSDGGDAGFAAAKRQLLSSGSSAGSAAGSVAGPLTRGAASRGAAAAAGSPSYPAASAAAGAAARGIGAGAASHIGPLASMSATAPPTQRSASGPAGEATALPGGRSEYRAQRDALFARAGRGARSKIP